MVALGGMVFCTRGLGGCARAHPPGVAPEALEEWIYSSRGFSHVELGVLSHFAEPTSMSSGHWVSAWLQEEPPILRTEREGGQEFSWLFV